MSMAGVFSLLLCLLATTTTTTTAFLVSTPSSTGTTTTTSLNAKPKVFIDGEAGTTGLQVRGRLEKRDDLEIISPPHELRKDEATRKHFLNEADAVILCLPDDASREAASWIEEDNHRTVLIDASTAFRTDDSWEYGFPELSKDQRGAIQQSKRISNPGCYPTGFIGLTRPLVDAGLIKPGTPLTVNAISGYSGGGKGLMQVYENSSDDDDVEPWGAYAFQLSHKHIPEMAKYSGLGKLPIFQPQVASFAQGMVVSVPLHYEWLNTDNDSSVGEQIHGALSEHYKDSKFVSVMPLGADSCVEHGLFERNAFLRPDSLKNTNRMELFVFHNDDTEQVVLCARLDNLGKGASGAAVQNLNLALGLEETTGL